MALSRQEAIRDIPLAELNRRVHNLGRYLDAVMLFIVFLNTIQHLNGICNAGLAHFYRLETALQCLVLFDIFAYSAKVVAPIT